jgi:GrpB-like predicted nucleotidyltransferase (UPF0157 family)
VSIVGLDHVQVAAPPGCEADARRFYGGALDLPELPKPAALRDRGGVWFALGSGQALHVGVTEDFAAARKAHPALAVAGGTLATLADRLLEAGCEVRWDDAIPQVQRCYVDDPWGNRLELVEKPRAELLGPRERHDAPVVLAEYDPAWVKRYEEAAAAIRGALGDRVVVLEHVGSTSVPGMAAKPYVDIVLAVPDSSAEDDYVPALEAAGFVLRAREPDWFEHRFMRTTDRTVQVHVFTAGASEIDRMIAFRDRLRASPEDFDRYLGEKRRLAARRWEHVQDYADAKAVVVEEIVTRAGGASRR